MNVYDFDGTILNGDSEYYFLLFVFSHYPKTWKYILGSVFAYKNAKSGKISNEESRNIMYSCLNIFTKDEIISLVNKMWDKRFKYIKKYYLEQKNDDDVVISATPRFILEPIIGRLKIKHLIATEFDLDSLKSVGKFCWNEEKVSRFKKEFKVEDVDSFYSDSYSDQPMAKVAKRAIMVKGNNLLPWDFK